LWGAQDLFDGTLRNHSTGKRLDFR
jgi:hypothetical protein